MTQFLSFWAGVIFAIGALGVDLNDGEAPTPWGVVVLKEEGQG